MWRCSAYDHDWNTTRADEYKRVTNDTQIHVQSSYALLSRSFEWLWYTVKYLTRVTWLILGYTRTLFTVILQNV